MNEQGTSDAIRILERVMTMVPGMPILSCFESVCIGVILCNRTLRHTVDSISFIWIKLTNAMPMNRGSIVWMIVGNMDSLWDNQVSFLSYEMLRVWCLWFRIHAKDLMPWTMKYRAASLKNYAQYRHPSKPRSTGLDMYCSILYPQSSSSRQVQSSGLIRWASTLGWYLGAKTSRNRYWCYDNVCQWWFAL